MSIMSRIPHHKNIVQAHLYGLGKKEVGADSANVMSDVDVRRRGAKRIGRRVLQGAAGVAAVGVAVAGVASGAFADRDAAVQQDKHDAANNPNDPDVVTANAQHVVSGVRAVNPNATPEQLTAAIEADEAAHGLNQEPRK